MGLAAICLALAVRLRFGLDRWALAAASGIATAAMIGYILSRTTGLPGATDDIGDWANPLGLAALAVEAVLIPLPAARSMVPLLRVPQPRFLR